MKVPSEKEVTVAEVNAEEQKKYYSQFADGGTSGYLASWVDDNQMPNIQEVLKQLVKTKCKSVLDVGSGVGELYRQIEDLSLEVEYKGIDITPKIVARVKDFNPKADIIEMDIFNHDIKRKYDAVVACGTFNLQRGTTLEQHRALLKQAFERMDKLSKKLTFVSFSYCHDPEGLFKDVKGVDLIQRRGWDGSNFLSINKGDDWFVIRVKQ
jgi:SAM-dependent methyltransferase